MTIADPFASAPAEDEAQPYGPPENDDSSPFSASPAEAPAPAKKAAPKKAVGTVNLDVKPNLLPLDEGKVVLTFKGGTGFDAPWIVVHAKDVEDALDVVSGENAAKMDELMKRVQIAGKLFGGYAPVSENASAGRPQRQAAPAAAQQPPAGSPPSPGEGWVYKSGVTKSGPKAGQTWQAWMPPQHLKDAGTKPVWF